MANRAEQTLRLQDLSRLMNAIGERHSVPFLMFYRGYGYREIAAHLALPVGTVLCRIFQARQRCGRRSATADSFSHTHPRAPEFEHPLPGPP